MTDELKILNRVKKMLALGNDAAAAEGERENALRMAYNLLAKHNLAMSDIPGDEMNEGREKQEITVSADKWARSLSGSVARLFFCKYFFSLTRTSGKDNHYFVGRVSNVTTAMLMAEFIIKSIKREASKRYKSSTTPEGRSFCVGTVNAIHHRVTEMLKTDTEATVGSALVLADLHKTEADANALWLSGEGVELVSSKSRAASVVGSAFRDGKAFGATVSLANQVGHASPRVKLLA